jgi:superfamily II DNA or RNA helicase
VIVDAPYEYGEAVADGVCRRVEFHAYDGEARWVDCGRVVAAELGADLRDEDVSIALRTVFDPDRPWMRGILETANRDLIELRREVSDAGGLVIADTQDQAKACAGHLREITGEEPVLAISEDPQAQKKIEKFRKGASAWLVAVRMVSEGVDIKRLMVGVYATRYKTPLFFRQVVGRFVRVRDGEDVNARLFIPAVPTLTAHAREIEEELRHQLDLECEKAERALREAQEGERSYELRQPLSASDAQFVSSIFGGREASAELHARAEAWCRERNIPAMYAPNVVPDLLADEQPVADVTITPKPSPVPRFRQEKMLRAEIKALVTKVAHRDHMEYQEVNTVLLKEGFPRRDKSSIEDLEAVREFLTKWLTEP